MYKKLSKARYFTYLLRVWLGVSKLIRSRLLIGILVMISLVSLINLSPERFPRHLGNQSGFAAQLAPQFGRDVEIWNNDGDFELSSFDTGELYDQCFIDAPWGDESWGVEGSSFDDGNGNPPPGYTKDASRFASFSGQDAYLYGRNNSDKWSFVRFIQGDVFGRSNCGSIPWHVPEPWDVAHAEPVVYVDIYRDVSNLLTDSSGWYLLGINVWFQSRDLAKPLVMDLIFSHDCNWSGCTYEHFEDDPAYHYQSFIGETPVGEWRSWRVPLNDHIEEALEEFDESEASDTLQIYQLEFVIELRNAEGAASIDNFFLVNEPSPTATSTPTATYTPIYTNALYLPLLVNGSR